MMTVHIQRRIDRFFGVPLCLLSALTLRFRRRQNTHLPPSVWKCVLVIKFFGLGSIVQASAFLQLLQRRAPSARIIFLTFSRNRAICERIPQIAETFTIRTVSLGAFLRDTLSVMARIRALRPTVVFDLEFFSKFSTLMSSLSGAPLRVGFALPTRWRLWNLTHSVPLDTSEHISAIFCRLLGHVTHEALCAPLPSFRHADPAERMAVEQMLHRNGVSGRIICVNVNAGTTSLERRWPRTRFIMVAQALSSSLPDARYFFIGTSEERAYVQGAVDHLAGSGARVTNCAGQLTLGELIALLERADLLLTNDTGPMHLAGVLGTPTVALFGPESPVLYAPGGSVTAIYQHLPCSPCLSMYTAKQFHCPYNARCMRDITPEMVTTAAERLLAGRYAFSAGSA